MHLRPDRVLRRGASDSASDAAYVAQLQISIAFVSLYQLLGFYGLVGVAIMVLSLPLNAMIARLQTRLQKEQMKSTRRRSVPRSSLQTRTSGPGS